jgi:hemerythrin-like domain-containing protein
MQATDDLRAEHCGVLRMCGILEGIAERARAGEVPPAEDTRDIIEFLTVFVDGCHHHKEEELLFPALEQPADDRVKSLVEELEAEHDEGRAQVAALTRAVDEPADQGAAALAEASAAYAALLRGHIETEEEEVFEVADRILPEAEQTRLESEYERVEREVVGPGRHEAFHAMLDDMSARYASEA